MVEVLKPDLCVIGAGAGGSAAAAAAAALGAKVVVVAAEDGAGSKGRWIGTRLLQAATRPTHHGDNSAATEPETIWRTVRARLAEDLTSVLPQHSLPRLRAMNVTVVPGPGRFCGRKAVETSALRIEARRFIVATGSSPEVPKVQGLELVQWYTPDSIWSSDRLPTGLVITGGGSHAVEMAQSFRRLGSRVTLVAPEPVLADFDDEIAAPILDSLRKMGVVVLAGAALTSVEPVGRDIRAHLADGTVLAGSQLLLASGRWPNVDGLGLEIADVRVGPNGIVVGRDLRTSNRRVFAIGDVIGASSAQAAASHASLAVRKALFRLPARLRPELIPRVIFTDPEVAVCGLSEQAAHGLFRRTRILRASLGETERAAIDGLGRGHIKVVTSPSGRVLGAAIVGASAGELIGSWQVAISRGMTIADLSSIVFPRLTLSDAGRQVILAGIAPRLRSPWVARALSAARWFG